MANDDCIEPHFEHPNYCIYVLALSNECFYVGRTTNYRQQLTLHFAKGGDRTNLPWLLLNYPVKVVETYYSRDIRALRRMFMKYVTMYGYQKVRGYIYTNINLTNDEIRCITQMNSPDTHL